MKKRITITNAYTWYNKGDAGILQGIVSALKEQYGEDNIEINILSFTPDIDKENYCKDKIIKGVYSNILNPHPYKHTKLGKLVAMMKLTIRMSLLYIKTKISLKKTIKSEESLRILNDSDLIIVCGGGFLGGKKYDSLMHVFQIYINTLFKKPVIVMGTSIEPIKKKMIKKYTEKVLKKVDFVYARENITFEYLKTFLNEDKFTLIPDMAFMLNEEKKEFDIIKKIREKTNMIVGITVRNWKFPNLSISSVEAMEIYMNAIKQMMIKNINEKNAYFVFVPQVIVDTGDDTIVAKKIKGMLPEQYKEHFEILQDDLSPNDIKSLIGNFDYFIGTRMHSNIFATSMKIPTLAIAYEKKTNGIMETVDLSKYIVEMDTITENELIEKFNECIESRDEIVSKLNYNIPLLRQKIMQEISKVMSKYED